MPPEWRALREKVSDVVAGLTGVSEDLQEISRGIHPAILSRGGLDPALKTLARRSAVPVELRLGTDRRLPEAAEVAAYYVVAEALTNVAKYAQASEVRAGVDAAVRTCGCPLPVTESAAPTRAKGPDSSGWSAELRRLGAAADLQRPRQRHVISG
jgi:hypothetical protein